MGEENKERSWEQMKQTIKQRPDFRAKILHDNTELLVMSRGLLDKLIEYKELCEQTRNLTWPSES